MADDAAPEDFSLDGVTWPEARTLFRFFVAWEDEEPCCGADVEARQVAISTTQSLLTCLFCHTARMVAVEIAEVVI